MAHKYYTIQLFMRVEMTFGKDEEADKLLKEALDTNIDHFNKGNSTVKIVSEKEYNDSKLKTN